jgi:hypothetical protein
MVHDDENLPASHNSSHVSLSANRARAGRRVDEVIDFEALTPQELARVGCMSVPAASRSRPATAAAASVLPSAARSLRAGDCHADVPAGAAPALLGWKKASRAPA